MDKVLLIFYAVLGIALSAFPLVKAKFSKDEKIDALEPVYYISLQFLILYPLRSLLFVLGSDEIVTSSRLNYDYLIPGMELYLISHLLFLVGYYAIAKKIYISRFSIELQQSERTKKFILIILILFLMSYLYRWKIGEVFTIYQSIQDIAQGTLFSFLSIPFDVKDILFIIAFALALYFKDIFYKINALTIFAIYLLHTFITTTKQSLIYIFFIPLLIYNYTNIRKKFDPKIIFGIFVFLALFIYFSVSTYVVRQYGDVNGSIEGVSTYEAIRDNFNVLFKRKNEIKTVGVLGFQNRFHGLDSMALYLQQSIDSTPHTFLERYSFFHTFSNLIPRAVWQNKPIVNPHIWFGNEYWGGVGDTSIPFFKPVEFMLYFGYAGLALNFIFGMICRKIYEWYVKKINIEKTAIYFMVYKLFFSLEYALLLDLLIKNILYIKIIFSIFHLYGKKEKADAA